MDDHIHVNVVTPDTESSEPSLTPTEEPSSTSLPDSTSSPMPSPEPTHAPPVKIKHARKFIFGYIALIVVMAVIAGVYNWQHKKVISLNTQLSSLNNQVSSLQKQVTSLNSTIKKIQAASASSTTTAATGLVKYTSWSSAPSDIQQGVLVAWNDASPNYKTKPTSTCNTNTPSQATTTNNPIYTENGKFIVTEAGCSIDSSIYLIVKNVSVWKDIGNTQLQFNCSTLTQYNVPTDLIVAAMQATATNGHVQCLQINGPKNLS